MMGCRPILATKTPFHSPHANAVSNAHTMATHMGKRLTCWATPSVITSLPPTIRAATAALMATVAPTEMSMPRVAITRVMPSDTSISGAARFRMSMTLPYRWPSRHCSIQKPGFRLALTIRISTSVTAGHSKWCVCTRVSKEGVVGVLMPAPQSWRRPPGHSSRPAVRPPWRGRAAPRCGQRRAPPRPSRRR